MIIVHVHWTKLESANIQFKGEDKVIWALGQINNNAYESHSSFSSWSSPLDPKEKKRTSKNEKNYLHGKAPNKQKKNGKSFRVFLFNYYYYKHGRLTS